MISRALGTINLEVENGFCLGMQRSIRVTVTVTTPDESNIVNFLPILDVVEVLVIQVDARVEYRNFHVLPTVTPLPKPLGLVIIAN